MWAAVIQEKDLVKRIKGKCEELVGGCVAGVFAGLKDSADEATNSLKTLALLSKVLPESLQPQLQLLCPLLDPPAGLAPAARASVQTLTCQVLTPVIKAVYA